MKFVRTSVAPLNGAGDMNVFNCRSCGISESQYVDAAATPQPGQPNHKGRSGGP